LPGSTFTPIDTASPFAKKYIFVKAYASSLTFVKKRLKKYPNVKYYRGIFPKTAKPVKDCKFCFVHLDADLFNATYHGIEFFYPRLVDDGIILVHNYDDFEGVRKAVDHFFYYVERLKHKHCLIRKNYYFKEKIKK
jgi:hypothetical protein